MADTRSQTNADEARARRDVRTHLHANNRGRAADDEVEELCFDDAPPPRSGDPLTREELAEALPDEREREAGMSGGELPQEGITDDDLTPETLYDEEDEYEVYAVQPADKDLRIAQGSEIGGGSGLDEAELARRDHPGP